MNVVQLKLSCVKFFWLIQESDGRRVTFIVDLEVVGKVGASKLPKPKSMEELQNSLEDDSFGDCCPWLDLTRCRCNCTEYPRLMNVVLPDCNADNDEPEYNGSTSSSNESDEDIVIVDEILEYEEEECLEEPCDEREAFEEESVPLFTEYVGLRGCSFHADCQSTLKKCREILAAKGTVELRLQTEPDNIRDCNAIIVQAKVNLQWDSIGYIPKEKVPKFYSAMKNGEIQDAKFKNIKCQYIMVDSPKWTCIASIIFTKTGKWLPNDGLYKYNDKL